tara:strand:- start:155 stop:352 length:198 start_codon:yes stop_codon:yes gene_type:complete
MKYTTEEQDFILGLEGTRMTADKSKRFASIYKKHWGVTVCISCGSNFYFYLKATIKLIKQHNEKN